LFLYFLSYH